MLGLVVIWGSTWMKHPGPWEAICSQQELGDFQHPSWYHEEVLLFTGFPFPSCFS